MNVYYNNDYVASLYAFDTTRKSEHIALSLKPTPLRELNSKTPQATLGQQLT